MNKLLLVILSLSAMPMAFGQTYVGKLDVTGDTCNLVVNSKRANKFYNIEEAKDARTSLSKLSPYFNKTTATEFYIQKLEQSNPQYARTLREYHRSGMSPTHNPDFADCAFTQQAASAPEVGPWGPPSGVVVFNLCLRRDFSLKSLSVTTNGWSQKCIFTK